MEHRLEEAAARPEQRGEETGGMNRASTVDLLNSPVMILQPESEKDLDTLSRAFEVPAPPPSRLRGDVPASKGGLIKTPAERRPPLMSSAVGCGGWHGGQPLLGAHAPPSRHPHRHIDRSMDSLRPG